MTENPFARRLRAAGLRPTSARVSVLELLSGTPDALRVEGVYRRLIERGIQINANVIYRLLKDMCEAGILLSLRDVNRAARYRFLPEIAQKPSFHLTSRDGNATFSDPKLYTRLLVAATHNGLELDGQEFTLRACFEPQDTNSNEETQ
jgi:Fe2+ or Zn2+ uptake regulation protein